jgi:hypothetical protein
MKTIVFFIIIFYSIHSFAQVDTTQIFENVESLLEDATKESEDSQIFDSIEYFLNNPILLNKTSINELLQIPYIDLPTAQAIIRRRNLLGGIFSIQQLNNIEGVSSELIEKIIPFLKLGDEESISLFDSFAKNFQNVLFKYRTRIQYDIQERSGFSSNNFLGSRPKYYNRFLINSLNSFRLGAVIEKDAGEESFTDFTSFHLQISEIGFVKNILVGDFNYEFGQGLALWSPYSFSKGSDAVKVISKRERKAYLYSSTDENKFFRGISFQVDFWGLSIIPFYSFKSIDASIDSITNTVTSFVEDGYHRTSIEINKRDKVDEKILGLAAYYSPIENTNLGLLIYNSTFNPSLKNTNVYKPRGSDHRVYSLSYSTVLQKLSISGEWSYNNISFASINNFKIYLGNNFSLIFSLRNYPRNYYSFHSNGFGEKSTTQNEAGFYAGFYWEASFGTFNFYYDQFKIPIAATNYNFSAQGNDFLLNYYHKFFQSTAINIRLKTEVKEQVETLNSEFELINKRTTNFRGEINHKISRNLQMRTRAEVVIVPSTISNPKEFGTLFFYDLKYIPLNQLSIQSRIIFFSTDSYNSRVYEFENDLIGVMTNPALYGEGFRWYLLLKYSTKFGLHISFKYSELHKPNEKTLSSGSSEIFGNLDNRISFQLDFNF